MKWFKGFLKALENKNTMKQGKKIWNKQLGFMLSLMLIYTMTAQAQDTTRYVRIESENLRNGPNGQKIAEIQGGTKVKVLETQSNWVKVQFTGWIWGKSLTSDPTDVQGFKVRGSHILVGTEAEARQILSQLKSGTKFEDLAKTKSIDKLSAVRGGDLGIFGKGDLLPEFENIIFNLKINEISGVVKSSLGYHIMKRTE